MPVVNSDEIRRTFISFYEERGHLHIPSASLVPHGDPTLLFTSAGMVPFKPYFMGLAEPPAARMTTVQKCFRTTDIDEVGDFSHLTFFEMLGNFSIGDYFKKEAIAWAWELLTERFKLDGDRLWVSIYLDDDEAHDLWRAIGIPEERIHRYDRAHNYWPPGDWDGIGPCGPNSEIFVDRGPRPGCEHCARGECKPNLEPDCGRFLEVWNLVFMTLYQDEDGKRTPLPRKNIDTGSGLERVTTVLQGKDTVYDTDIFRPIITKIATYAETEYGKNESIDRAIRIVAEHVRAAIFLITDGVMPSSDGRGYVLRRLIRRALYFLSQLVQRRRQPGFVIQGIAASVIETMNYAYPELNDRRGFTIELLRSEEIRFGEAMRRGREVFDSMVRCRDAIRNRLREAIAYVRAAKVAEHNQHKLRGLLEDYGLPKPTDIGVETASRVLIDGIIERTHAGEQTMIAADAQNWVNTITGPEAFLLSDTYGFPIELTIELAREHGLSVHVGGYQAELEAQRERGRAAAKFEFEAARVAAYTQLSGVRARFLGYDTTRHASTVAAIVGAAGLQERAEAGEECELVLHETPFYPEGGGQAGDTGAIIAPGMRFAVEDTQSPAEGLIVHRGRVVEGTVALNDAVTAQVDEARRRACQRNHTATHILHAALRAVLGSHVRQAGSLVAPDRLRFDFTHIEATKPDQLAAVQRLVNEKIREDIEVHPHEESYDDAIASGAMALFGEKYTAKVRVVDICDEPQADRCFSRELCGGTHCHRTGEIGTFIIASEGSVGAGLRRIEALTGPLADAWVIDQQERTARLARQLNAAPTEIEARIEALRAELDAERRRLQQLERQAGRAEVETLLSAAEQVDGAAVLVSRVPATNAEAMREMGDLLRERLGSAVVVLGAVLNERPSFLAMVTPDLAKKVHAGNLIKQVAAVAGGGGGGRPEMAQAGGKDAAKLDDALALARRLAHDGLAGGAT